MTLTLVSFPPHSSRAPRLDPPYDDEAPASPAIDGSLALALALPLQLPARPALHLVPPMPDAAIGPAPGAAVEDAADDPHWGYVVTPRSELPDPRPRAAQLVRAVLEVLAGDRPLQHLMRVTATPVQGELDALPPPVAGRRPWARSVRSVHVSEPTDGVAEVTAVVDRGSRCAALALRMQGLDGRWLITALDLVG